MAGVAVAVTGSGTFLGRALVRALEAEPGVSRVIAVDGTAPAEPAKKAQFERIDLVHPRAAEQLAALLTSTGAEVLVHTAFLARPVQSGAWAHELESVGTRHVLAA